MRLPSTVKVSGADSWSSTTALSAEALTSRRGTTVIVYEPPPTPVSSATDATWAAMASRSRSEEHTSELQSLMRISYAVFCLKTKKNNTKTINMKYKCKIYTYHILAQNHN